MDEQEGAAREAQGYAWNWFALHAGQRMQLVNFWLISVAFLVAAYVQAQVNGLKRVAFAVALVGILASLAFWLLDVRTSRLVKTGEAALRYLEVRRSNEGLDRVTELVHAADSEKPLLQSYRIIIQGLQLSTASIFCAAALYTLS